MGSKGIHEREVFLEFVRAAGLRVDPSTVESRSPPEPDILCLFDYRRVYFELGRLLDEGMQRVRLRAMRRAPQLVGLDGDVVRIPEREMLRKKLAKKYVGGSTAIELLLYYDNENRLVGDVPVFEDSHFAWHAEQVMVSVIEESPKVFERIWVYERHRQTVLWTCPEHLAV